MKPQRWSDPSKKLFPYQVEDMGYERVALNSVYFWPDCSREEVGFASLHRLFHRIADRDGAAPPVVFSGDLVEDPAGTARAYCDAVDIPFIPEALEWEAGDRSEVSWYGEGSGSWHDNLRQSTGIQKPKTTSPKVEENSRLFELYERALPLFEDLRQLCFTPSVSSVSSNNSQVQKSEKLQ